MPKALTRKWRVEGLSWWPRSQWWRRSCGCGRCVVVIGGGGGMVIHQHCSDGRQLLKWLSPVLVKTVGMVVLLVMVSLSPFSFGMGKVLVMLMPCCVVSQRCVARQ